MGRLIDSMLISLDGDPLVVLGGGSHVVVEARDCNPMVDQHV